MEKALDERRTGSEQRIAYFNGEYVKESEVKISLYDRGFTYGDAVYDIARTYNHKPYKYEEHVERLYRSLRYVQIDPMLTPEETLQIALKVTEHNVQFIPEHDDYRMTWRITRGEGMVTEAGGRMKPTVIAHNDRPGWGTFAEHYIDGGHLIVARTRVEDPQTVDVKCSTHNKLAHVLADVEAKKIDPDGIALMLDVHGCIAEAYRAHFFLVSKGKLLTPPVRSILPGVCRAEVLELAKELGIEAAETDLWVYDLYNADEIFITATSPFVEPISKVDTVPLDKPFPGPITKRLISAFSEKVGVDIVKQAQLNV